MFLKIIITIIFGIWHSDSFILLLGDKQTGGILNTDCATTAVSGEVRRAVTSSGMIFFQLLSMFESYRRK